MQAFQYQALDAVVTARLTLRRKLPRRHWHPAAAPGLSPLIRGVNTSRFASTLAILVDGGVPLLAALASGVRVMTNMVLRGR